MFVAGWMVAAQAQSLSLSFPQLAPGVQTTFTVSGLNAGESTTLVRANAVGAGVCPPVLGGSCLGITGSPAIVASAVADAGGVARIVLTVPRVADGTPVALQAVAVRGAGGVSSVLSRPVGTTVSAGPICPVYADPTVVPGGDGSAGQPYPSVGYAIGRRDPTCTEVLLYPGTYDERVDYGGADLSIGSVEGRAVTVLTSSVHDTVVSIQSGETAVLQGVTVRCGAIPTGATGLRVTNADATLTDLQVEGCGGNTASIGLHFESATGELTGSIVRDNVDGGMVAFDSDLTVRGNSFLGNRNAHGNTFSVTGLYVSGGSVVLDGNVFQSQPGTVVEYAGASTGTVSNNLFVDNPGASTVSAAGDNGVVIVNNTLDGNNGYGIQLYNSWARVENNIISRQSTAVSSAGTVHWIYRNNDAYPAIFSGLANQTGLNGNMSVDPRFVGNGDRHLAWGSLCIDAGRDTSADGVTVDIEGTARPQGLAHDLGAYESW